MDRYFIRLLQHSPLNKLHKYDLSRKGKKSTIIGWQFFKVEIVPAPIYSLQYSLKV
jgi:hypothetical protein